jgi:PAS domain S-box-containing protein
VARWRRAVGASALRTVAVYVVLGLAWIAFSDIAVEWLVRDPHMRAGLQTIKGAIFVFATAAVLYQLIARGESGLRALGTELRATIDSMPDAVLLVDRRSRIVEANPAAVELLGLASREELLGSLEEWGKRFQLRLADGSPVQFERYATVRALAGERVAAYDAILRRADGRDVWVGVSAAPVTSGRRRPELAVAVLRDVSGARRLEEMRDEFLAAAAHEFKTPLAVVKAYAQLVRKRTPSEAEALSVVDRQVDRLNRLVEHLLDLSRLDTGGPAFRAERFDLARVAAEVVEPIQAQAPRHAIRVRADGPAPVVGDPDRIARVVRSLVDNAIRFSPDGGPIDARVDGTGGEVVFTIEDRGLGIPEDRQARVFERYYRAHAGSSDDPGGLGVALGLSREIVARHGGRMWFESAPGRGSAFHFSLPRAPAAREGA